MGKPWIFLLFKIGILNLQGCKDFITNIYIMEEPNINYKRLYELSIIEKNNLLKEIDNQKNELINCKNEIIDLTI